MAEDQDQESAVLEEEYTVWKKNSPFLYDLLISHPLEWPSLTVHWAPSAPQPHTDPSLAAHKLVLGTHTSDDYPNFLMVADALLPTSQPNFGSISENDPVVPKVEITQKIRVFEEVNRARWMPQKSTIVGAKTSGADVYVFDCSKQEGKKHQDEACDPDLRLRGHDKEGGSYDCKICLWDVSASAQEKVLDPIHVYERHEMCVVGDVSWHPKNENLFGSVGDDCQLMIWDMRTDQTQDCVKAHEKEVNSLSFNPYNERILATASSDTTVGLFDMRKLTISLHVLSSHGEEVFQVEWDPNHETVLASFSHDRRLMVWDLNRYSISHIVFARNAIVYVHLLGYVHFNIFHLTAMGLFSLFLRIKNFKFVVVLRGDAFLGLGRSRLREMAMTGHQTSLRTRRSQSKDIGFLVEQKRAMGHIKCC
ncbi:WD-40 repeat-containing protein MSI3-like [Pyrus communis]|uniref:WD-40 repeat-containing protein MSI3-like n=1 Tax=Pyrus communis TaxID=23211 RepID=UPI0035C07AB6